MNMSVHRNSANTHIVRPKPANFGTLNSAIARGDLEAAQSGIVALQGSDSKSALAVKASGHLGDIETAIMSGDANAARSALADFRKGRGHSAESATPPVASAPTIPPTAEEAISLVTGLKPVDLRQAQI